MSNILDKYSIRRIDNLSEKNVLLRLDYNVSLGEDNILDDSEAWRILQSMDSLEYLSEAKNVFIISHIGRDKGDTLAPVYDYLKKQLDINFFGDFSTESVNSAISSETNLHLFENLRSNSDEKENKVEFLLSLVGASDVYVNDAFSVSHRSHASLDAVMDTLPAYLGFQFMKEYKKLSEILSVKSGAALVLGGAKFGTKLPLLRKLLGKFDYVLMGGALANVFLKARGFEIGDSYYDKNADVSDLLSSEKIVLPVDIIDQHGDILSLDELKPHDQILDIGPETNKLFSIILSTLNTVVWNGPLGKYEDGFVEGSHYLMDTLENSSLKVYTGGGDTGAVILDYSSSDKYYFVSTAGGAMLDFLLNETLPLIEKLKDKQETYTQN